MGLKILNAMNLEHFSFEINIKLNYAMHKIIANVKIIIYFMYENISKSYTYTHL